MSPTIHAGTIVAAGTYEALVQARRSYGQRTYGDRHLQREDLLGVLVEEAADTKVYLRLEQQRWELRRPDLADRLGDRLDIAIAAATAFGRLCSGVRQTVGATAAGGPFDAVFAGRWQFGADNYGDAYLDRDNLAEALEEVADAQIAVLLERERLTHHGALDGAVQHALEVLDHKAAALGHFISSLRTAAQPWAAAA